MSSNPQQNNNPNLRKLQEKITISNLNPLYKQVPGYYRESYKIIRCQIQLTSTDKLVYDEILYYFQESGKHGYEAAIPSQKTIANNIGCSVRSVRRSLKNLEKEKLITINNRKGVWGNHKEYIIQPFPPKVWESYLQHEKNNLNRMKDYGKSEYEIKAKENLIREIQDFFEAAKLSCEQKENPKTDKMSVLENGQSVPFKSGQNVRIEADKVSVLEGDSKASYHQPSDAEKSAPINQSYLSEYNNHHHDDDDSNFLDDNKFSNDDRNHLRKNPSSKKTAKETKDSEETEKNIPPSGTPDSKISSDNLNSIDDAQRIVEFLDDLLSKYDYPRLSSQQSKRNQKIAREILDNGYTYKEIVAEIESNYKGEYAISSLNYFKQFKKPKKTKNSRIQAAATKSAKKAILGG